MIKVKKLDLNEYKKLYAQERIIDGKFEKLPIEKASDNVAKISCFGSLDKEGYEHGFLYLKKNSRVYEHLHDKDIEFYKLVSGDKNICDSTCLLGDKHEIKEVCCDTIVETFKLNKSIIKQDYDISLLNEYLKKQAEAYLWRIDQLLFKLAYDKDDFCYKDIETLAFEYQISIEEINCLNDIYFYKRDYLPFNLVELEIGDAGCEFRTLPYRIEDCWKYQICGFSPRVASDFDSTFNDIRTRQNKSLVKNRKIISD